MPVVADDLDLGALYRQAREQVATLVRSLSPEELEAAVPATPGWTVHGVVSHLAGVATDAVNGRLRGIPSPEQTAAQVEERATTPTSIVLREWERTGSQLEALLTKSGGRNVFPVIDVAVHEQDIRGAVGIPGNREGSLVDLAVSGSARLWMSKVESTGLPAVAVRDESGTLLAGSDEATVTFRASRFELLRAIYGRRSRGQIERRFQGVDDPTPYLELLCVFGPAERDLIE